MNTLAESTVYEGHRVLAMFPFFDEEDKIRLLSERLQPGIVDKFLAINDGSTDSGPSILRERGIEVLDQQRSGIGACIKRCIKYAQENDYDVLVVMAGNNKDDPAEIPRLLDPILSKDFDYVQGSRFLEGGSSPNLPKFRKYAIKFLSRIFQIYAGKQCTDLTNGFRAYKISLFNDPDINVWQEWLDTYEYEYYVHFKAYKLEYKVTEVGVTKAYPEDPTVSYSKIPPLYGWWKMLRPLVLLALKIKH
jgi:dolichol-phosphate mannosyltransferase